MTRHFHIEIPAAPAPRLTRKQRRQARSRLIRGAMSELGWSWSKVAAGWDRLLNPPPVIAVARKSHD